MINKKLTWGGSNFNIYKLLVLIFIYAVFVTSGTYAYMFISNSNNSISGTGECNTINYKANEINVSNLVSTTNYLEGEKTTITLSQNENCKIYNLVSIYIHTNDTTTAPITTVKALKYKVYQGSTKLSEGIIDSFGDTKIATVPLTETSINYDVYIYIDANISLGRYNSTSYSGYIYSSSSQTSTVNGFLVRDLSYDTNDAIAYGATWDKYNNNITTDGTDDYVDCGLENYDFGSAITVVSRFKLLSYKDYEQNIIDNYEGAGSGLSVYNHMLYFQIFSKENNAYSQAQYSTELSINTWYTAVGTYDGSTLKLYLNGELVASTSVSGTIKPSSAPFHLAANPNAYGEASAFSNFTYSDVIIYTKSLSVSEISSIFSGEIDKTKVNKNNLLMYYNFE